VKCLAVAFLLAIAAPAMADEPPPWATGVSDADQERANALFAEGNQLFAQLAHAPALEKYRGAIVVWDHPMIRFNMAVTLIRLDRILEAAEELEKALAFGNQPFSPELYQQALDYQNLVRRQLAHIEVRCDLPGTKILLDGKPWFVAPGTRSIRVTSGEHVLVAERKDYLTVSRPLVVAGGSTVRDTLQLVPLEKAVIVEYPSPRWIPWTVTGVGAALALGGLGLWLKGKSELDDFEREFRRECPMGCELAMHPSLADAEDSALFKGKAGVTLMISGGAATVTGLLWTLFNTPSRRLPKVEIAPMRSGAAANARWSF
jgi:hypothetical protein